MGQYRSNSQPRTATPVPVDGMENGAENSARRHFLVAAVATTGVVGASR